MTENATPAQAQETDAALQAAKSDFEEGQTLYIREQWNEAAAKFLSAYDKKDFPAFLFNAAVAFEKAKKYEQGLQFFEKYLERDPNARDGKEVKERIEGLKAIIANPAPEKPQKQLSRIDTKGLVIIDSKPQGADIYLNDKKAGVFGKTPWSGSLPPKPVKILIESKGFKPDERSISPRTDKVYEVYIALSEEHFLGWVEIASNVAGASVFIDKKEIGAMGQTPYTGHLKPGKHTIFIERYGYKPEQKEIEVQPGTATTHMVTLEKVPNGWIAIVGKQTKGGKLKVNGAAACDTPCRHEVAPGKYQIAVLKEGFETYEGDVTVDRSSETTVNINLGVKPSRAKAWTAGVISALFLGGGVYIAMKGHKIEKDLKADATNPALFSNTEDGRKASGKYHYIGADALFGLSAITGAISLINFLSSGPDSVADVEQKQVGFAPFGLAGGGGFAATGRF